MFDPFFDIYQNKVSAKSRWEVLESKYIAEGSSSKNFKVTDFNNYKIFVSRPVMEQFHELQRILGQFNLY